MIDSHVLKEDPDHPVFHMDLDTRGMPYQTAQDLAVFPVNSEADIEKLAQAQSYDLKQIIVFRGGPEDVIPFPTPITVHDALQKFCDLSGPVGKDLMLRLAEYTSNESDKAELKRLYGLSLEAFGEEITKARVTLPDLLARFPSITIPIGDFVQIVGRILPRYFTIASSNNVHPNTIQLCVAILKEQQSSGALWTGLCTGFLEKQCRSKEYPVMRCFLAESKFKLPETPVPIVMIGNGCGIAPFRAFAQELTYRAESNSHTDEGYKCPEVSIFFGCQSVNKGFLYKHDFECLLEQRVGPPKLFEHSPESFNSKGVLTRFYCTFSRDQPQKIYIQEAVAQHKKRIYDILFKEDGCVYLCGSEGMVNDVTKIIQNLANMNYGLEGTRELNKLKMARKFVQESWG